MLRTSAEPLQLAQKIIHDSTVLGTAIALLHKKALDVQKSLDALKAEIFKEARRSENQARLKAQQRFAEEQIPFNLELANIK